MAEKLSFVDPYTGELVSMIPRNPATYDAAAVSDDSSLMCLDVSLAVQSALEESDINTIVRRFGLTGQLPTDLRAPSYGDFSEVGDYKSALLAVKAAADSFMQLPADVRSRFDNDPSLFVDFCSDPANLADMKKMGLTVPEKAPDRPIEVRVVAEPSAPPV